MKKTAVVFLLGFAAGLGAAYGFVRWRGSSPGAAIPRQLPDICYSCFWQGYDAKVHNDLIQFYRQFSSSDPLVAADAQYVLWRATGTPNCDARRGYRTVAARDPDPYRRFLAASILGFGAPECGESSRNFLQAAAAAAHAAALNSESTLLRAIADGSLRAHFEDVEIHRALRVPPAATTMVLGESKIEIAPATPVGVQVDRVVRDWVSAQMKWTPTSSPLPAPIIRYHEGALVGSILAAVPARVYPLAGTLVARRGRHWFAADETGTFRFEVLDDKLMYPTTHVAGEFGWIEDTHGISALVSQALERRVEVVIGCGDAEGKAKAAFYLAQKGVDVVFPGDRYQDLLLGYTGSGVLLGGVPVKAANGKALLGDQPVRFLLREPIVVEDTKAVFPIQYYDAAARYFRQLSGLVKLNLHYVLVDQPDQIERILEEARRRNAQAVAVRVATEAEDHALRAWLQQSPRHRAILFHSGLYPYAQALFTGFAAQVTFGDLHPRFE